MEIVIIITYFIVGMVISACIYAYELINNDWVWFSCYSDDASVARSMIVVFFWPVGLVMALFYYIGLIPMWLARKIWNR